MGSIGFCRFYFLLFNLNIMKKINKVLNIGQWDTNLFVFSLSANDFLKYAKIERAREWKDNIKNLKGFQRKLDSKRVSDIRNYILSRNSYIPTNFIVNICTQEHNENGFKWEAILDSEKLITLNSENDLLVIDWQHRLAALDYENYNSTKNWEGVRFKELTKEDKFVLDNYNVIITWYLNVSRIEMAKIFITINKNQKRVSKSVIFDLLHISWKDIDNIDQETEEILLSWLSLEQIKATSIIEELNETKNSYWFNAIKFEWWRMKTIELWSFVEHLTPLLWKNRFLNENDFPSHIGRVNIINTFYKKFIDSIFEEKRIITPLWEEIIISKYDQFTDSDCILSKASWVWITLNKDFFDKIMKLAYINNNLDEKILEKIFKNFNSNDFSSTNENYKWKLSSRAWYLEIIKVLSDKILIW